MEDLDNLLADLERATVHLRSSGKSSQSGVNSNQTMSSQVINNQSLSHFENESQLFRSQSPYDSKTTESDFQTAVKYSYPSPGTKTTTTTTTQKLIERYEYNSNKGFPEEPVYENDIMINSKSALKSPMSNQPTTPTFSANLSELDNLLEDLNSVRNLNQTRTSPRTQRRTTDFDLEASLYTEQTKKWPGKEIKPITVSKYYESTETRTSPKQAKIDTVPKQAAASNATRELDDLMASLSDFQVKEKADDREIPSPSTQKKQPLDSMLGNLQSDMSKHGVDTAPKGHCFACHKPIVGQVVTALGKTWHPEHFTCVSCNMELGTKNFFERDGEPYCEKDYHHLFSPRCAYCNSSILDKCITALDQTWHPEHFFCAQCGKQFTEDGYHEKDGKPYCRQDYFDLFAPKCAGCNMAITDNYISALNSQWHPDCFVCRDCRCPFVNGTFYDHEGQPYCETHYHAKRGSLCAGCHKPITGRCITAMFRKFHPEHFVCSFCLKQLNKGTFKEQNDKPYCHPCFEKLFG